MSLKSSIHLVAVLAMLIALAGCANNKTITASNPLYILVVVKQQLQLDVISRPTYHLAGTIPVRQVGNYPPSGAVGIGANGSPIVTYAGSVVNGQYAVTPNTESCTLQPAQCTTLIDGWGNATIEKTDNHIAASICNTSLDVSKQKCQIAFISNDATTVQKRIDLNPLRIGSIVVTPDDTLLYGIIYMTNVTPKRYELVRFDIAQHKLTATYDFGTQVPGSLAIAPDGTIYASILYASQGTKSNTQAQNQPGTQVEMFTPDLTPHGHFAVGQYPLFLTISPANGGTIALTYESQGPRRIDTFQVKTGALIKQYPLSTNNGDIVTSVSTLTNGHFASVITGPSSLSMGDFATTDNAIQWHKYDGTAISTVVG
jgi:hypothetical protein